MAKPRCEYVAHPAPLAGACSSSRATIGATPWDKPATRYVPYYFSPRAKHVRSDRSLYLCPAHAEMWNSLHPFGPSTLRLTP